MPKIENTKYERWYLSLIEKARSTRPLLLKIENTEKHHIIPRCLGGSDDEDNLVRLSIREHYIAHLLLIRMYDGQERYKLEWALFSLAGKPNRKLVLTSRQFEKCRQTLHTSMRGRKQSKEHVKKRILFTTGEGNGMHHSKGRQHPLMGVPCSEERKKNISNAQRKRMSAPDFVHPMTGKTRDDVTKQKISASKTGKPLQREHIEKISRSRLGKRNTIETLKKMSESAALACVWEVTSPQGTVSIVRGLSRFCKENGLNYTNLTYKARQGKPYLGYTIKKLLKDTVPEKL